jgi:hypothetical protein
MMFSSSPSNPPASVGGTLARLACFTALAGVLIAGICFPLIGGGALAAGGVAVSI